MPIKVEKNTKKNLDLAYMQEEHNRQLRFFYDRRFIYWYHADDPECAYQDELTRKIEAQSALYRNGYVLLNKEN